MRWAMSGSLSHAPFEKMAESPEDENGEDPPGKL